MQTIEYILIYFGNIPVRFWLCIMLIIICLYVFTNDVKQYNKNDNDDVDN